MRLSGVSSRGRGLRIDDDGPESYLALSGYYPLNSLCSRDES